MVTVFLLLAAAASEPSADAVRLGRQIAEAGTLATLLPLIQQKETEELVADHPQLSAADKSRLRATSARVYQLGRDRLMQAEARAFAQHLSESDLRAVLAFQGSAAGKDFSASMPDVIVDTMKAVGKLDFKGDVLAAYCKETGNLCAK